NITEIRRTGVVKAIVKNGVIVPRDPLPEDWREGTEVEVEKAPAQPNSDHDAPTTDAWMAEVEAIASQGDPEDDRRLEAALEEIRRREKEFARKGIPRVPAG